MWQLENHTPFKAERAWVRDKNGAEVWTVAVKGTFIINPDGTTSLDEEDQSVDVCMTPEYYGKPGESSLRYDTDMVHTKPATDILVNGHAYAPGGKAARQVDVALKAPGMTKILRVFGDRRWENGLMGLGIGAAAPFTKMPIVYERAFGGLAPRPEGSGTQDWERRNPIGTGFGNQASHLAGQLLPNIEYPKQMISSWKDRPEPAGFGPIPGHWSPRVEFAGTYDKQWEAERQPLLPIDFDEHFYMCAPRDQQFHGNLKGGEPIELVNLSRNGQLRFRLPSIALGFETYFGSEAVTHEGTLHTVIVEPDSPRMIMVWHTALPCHPKVLKLDQTVITHEGCIDSPC